MVSQDVWNRALERTLGKHMSSSGTHPANLQEVLVGVYDASSAQGVSVSFWNVGAWDVQNVNPGGLSSVEMKGLPNTFQPQGFPPHLSSSHPGCSW